MVAKLVIEINLAPRHRSGISFSQAEESTRTDQVQRFHFLKAN